MQRRDFFVKVGSSTLMTCLLPRAVVLEAIKEVLEHDFDDSDGDKYFFLFNSFERWLERQREAWHHQRIRFTDTNL